MAASQETEKKLPLNERINTFFQKNRKIILFGFLAVVIVLAGLITGISIREKMVKNALATVDEFSRRYNELRNSFFGDDIESIMAQAELTALYVELDGFAKKSFGFASARAYGMSADIMMQQKNWQIAEQAYLNAAKAAGKSYFAPVSFFNAAIAAEENGDIDAAISHYNQALNNAAIFPAAARAQFSVGRLEESRNNKLAALESYYFVLAKWPDEQLWNNLAQSRIIALSD